MNLRRLLLLEVVVGLFVSSSYLTAQTVPPVSLTWNASPSSEVTSYVLRYGTSSGVYSVATNVGNQTTASVSGLQVGQMYYLAVTARTATGLESPPSNQATYQAATTTNSLPIITLTSPGVGARYQSPATISCAASVTANGHTITKIQFLNGTTLLAEDAAAPYNYTWSGVAAGNYNLSARAVYGSGNTVSSSAVNVVITNPPVVVTNPPPASGLTFEASAGVITAPFSINGATLSQTVGTGLTTGGRAVYAFNIVTPGNYTVSANADAPSGSQNSFFVNIDAEPTDPAMIWHIPTTTGLQSRTVSWQGNGTVDSSQFAPKIFTLAAGAHQLVIRGREANVKLGTITIAPVSTSALPAPWQTVDIGTVGLTGSATQTNGVYTVRGAGRLTGTADSFRFVYQSLSADGEIKVRLSSVQTTNSNGSFGVMIRESLSPNSKYAFMGVSQDLLFRWQRRSSSGGSTSTTVATTATPPNSWVRLVRSGSTLTGYRSTDGVNWTQVNSRSISMAANIYVGFAVASGSTSSLGTAIFANGSVTP